MDVAVDCSGLKSAPTGPEEALDLAAPFTFWTETRKSFASQNKVSRTHEFEEVSEELTLNAAVQLKENSKQPNKQRNKDIPYYTKLTLHEIK